MKTLALAALALSLCSCKSFTKEDAQRIAKAFAIAALNAGVPAGVTEYKVIRAEKAENDSAKQVTPIMP